MHTRRNFAAAALLCGLLLVTCAAHVAASSRTGDVTGPYRSYLPLAFRVVGSGGRVDAPPTPSPTPLPPSGSVYTGVSISGAPWDMKPISDWEQNVAGKKASIIHYWSFWSDGGVFQRFDGRLMDDIRNRGSIPMVTWAPERGSGGPNQADFRLVDIISGRYDDSIKQWADSARRWGHPFFLRFAHEPDGSWFPWGEDSNGNQRGQYVQAWRHVHDVFTSVGTGNATWVWCINEGWANSPRPTYASLYPGDNYVDWTCIDGYNWGTQYGGWRSFDGIFRFAYDSLVQIAPSKPIMLGEWATAGIGGSPGDWIRDAYAQILTNYTMIRATVWYSWLTNVDWRIESSPGAPEAFRAAMQSSEFRGAQFSGLNTSPIPR